VLPREIALRPRSGGFGLAPGLNTVSQDWKNAKWFKARVIDVRQRIALFSLGSARTTRLRRPQVGTLVSRAARDHRIPELGFRQGQVLGLLRSRGRRPDRSVWQRPLQLKSSGNAAIERGAAFIECKPMLPLSLFSACFSV
jgi:hypothetical protein